MGLAPRARSTLRKTMARTSTHRLDRDHERAGGPRPLSPPRKRHGLPDRQPSYHRTRLPGPHRPGKLRGPPADTPGCTLDSAAHVKPGYAPERAPEPRQAATHTAPWPRFPSAIRPWTPQHNALQRYKVTRRDRDETPRQHENSQLAGRFRSVWQVLGSNQRRLSRRFYSTIPLTDSHAIDLRLCLPRGHPRVTVSAMCP